MIVSDGVTMVAWPVRNVPPPEPPPPAVVMVAAPLDDELLEVPPVLLAVGELPPPHPAVTTARAVITAARTIEVCFIGQSTVSVDG